MSVTIHTSHGIRRINVLGEIQGQVERLLLAAIMEPLPEPVEVILYDAVMVTAETALALAQLQAGDHRSQLIVYHSRLARYLHRLGLSFVYKNSYHSPAVQPEIKALALGGSADSLEKIIQVIEQLPASPVVVFIIQHVSSKKAHCLDQLLRTKTDYGLLIPHHMTAIQAGTIYIAPPGYHMRVHHQYIYLTNDKKQDYAKPSIGILFESLAREYGQHLVAALLCGYGRDGVDAMAVIQQMKGLALVERSDECKATTLVETAVTEGKFDLITSWQEIASLFAAAVEPELPVTDAQIRLFMAAISARYGYDFQEYAPGTLRRRISKRITDGGYSTFFSFQKDILSHPLSFERLFQEFSIGVTEFFRNPEQLAYLRAAVLPHLESFPHIRIWIAGCASGESAYSLAFLLEEAGLLAQTIIYATDINPFYLQQARNGLYPCQHLDRVRHHYWLSGGIRQFDDYVEPQGKLIKVAPRFQEKILFYQHSLVDGGVFNEFQLILCRNVMIYFSKPLQVGVLSLLASSLHKDGFLMLGLKEGGISTGQGERFFQVEHDKMKVYRWKQGVERSC